MRNDPLSFLQRYENISSSKLKNLDNIIFKCEGTSTEYLVRPSVFRYVCMYSCMYVCIYVCMYACKYVQGVH